MNERAPQRHEEIKQKLVLAGMIGSFFPLIYFFGAAGFVAYWITVGGAITIRTIHNKVS